MVDPEARRPESEALADQAQRTSLGAVVENAGNRVQEILDAAERVTAEIQADAEAAAARYLEERRHEADQIVEGRIDELADLTGGLKSRLASVQQEALALLAELEAITTRIVRVPSTGQGADPGGLRPVPDVEPAPQPVAYPGTGRPDRARQQGILRATQMAVAGTDRAEIERMLRTEFGIEDAAAVLDQLYGASPA